MILNCKEKGGGCTIGHVRGLAGGEQVRGIRDIKRGLLPDVKKKVLSCK